MQLSVNSLKMENLSQHNGYVELSREWKIGDEIVLDLQMQAEFLHPHPRIDAARGCVAIRRGPVIYAIESADVQKYNYIVDDFVVNTGSPIEETRINMPSYGESPALLISGGFREFSGGNSHPYRVNPEDTISKEMKITAIPYARWGNRVKGGMRVWIPTM